VAFVCGMLSGYCAVTGDLAVVASKRTNFCVAPFMHAAML
jgi:hypothetical protein